MELPLVIDHFYPRGKGLQHHKEPPLLFPIPSGIGHFTVVCLVAWPLNESEAGGDPALIETSLLFLC